MMVTLGEAELSPRPQSYCRASSDPESGVLMLIRGDKQPGGTGLCGAVVAFDVCSLETTEAHPSRSSRRLSQATQGAVYRLVVPSLTPALA